MNRSDSTETAARGAVWRTAVRALAAGALAAGLGGPALGQTLEFAAGAGNPTGDGPSLGPVTIQFQENTDNPTGNTMVAPASPVTATFSFSNQQFPNATLERNGMLFGARTDGITVLPNPLYPSMSAAAGIAASDFSSTAANVGAGIDLNANHNVTVLLPTYPHAVAQPATTDRIYVGDLTVSFSVPVQNPVLHVVGLAGVQDFLGFTAELELMTAGVTPSLLSGNTNLVVAGNNINNSNALLYDVNGLLPGTGSVLLTGGSISQLNFRLYLRGDGQEPVWTDGGGDLFRLAFSLPLPLPVVPPSGVHGVPSLSLWALVLLSFLLAAVAGQAVRPRRAGHPPGRNPGG